jgi:hypothetical protein
LILKLLTDTSVTMCINFVSFTSIIFSSIQFFNLSTNARVRTAIVNPHLMIFWCDFVLPRFTHVSEYFKIFNDTIK